MADATEPSVSDPSPLGLDGHLIEDATEPSVSDPSPFRLCSQFLEDVTDSSPSLVLGDATDTSLGLQDHFLTADALQDNITYYCCHYLY